MKPKRWKPISTCWKRFVRKFRIRYTTPSALFLGNIDPELQLDVLNKVTRPSIVACDTMNFWIDGKRDALWKVLESIDILVINDGEARALGEDPNLVQVAKRILSKGPKTLIVKRGEYGVLMFHQDGTIRRTCVPLRNRERSHRSRRHVCRRIYGIPLRIRELLRGRTSSSHYLRKRDGFVQCRRIQP